jgi:hypothetical protein
MATTPNVPIRKSLKNKLIITQQVAIYTAIVGGLGFYGCPLQRPANGQDHGCH